MLYCVENKITTRTCYICKVEFPKTGEYFPRSAKQNGGFDYKCHPCGRILNKKYRDSYAGRRKRTDSRYKRVFGITLDEAEAMLESQGGCGICDIELDWTTFVVDHCHETGSVRGILCNKCNTGIGMMGDDPARVQRAVEYLDWRPEPSNG